MGTFFKLGKAKAAKGEDRLRLSSAVPKIQWDSNPHYPYGYIGLWETFTSTYYCLMKVFVISAIYWLGYEQMKAKVLKERGAVKLTFAESFLAGATAGTVSMKL